MKKKDQTQDSIKEQVEPFDRTEIMLDVPELPEEVTLILPSDQPKPKAGAAAEVLSLTKPSRLKGLLLWSAAVVLLTAGLTWPFLGSGPFRSRSASPETMASNLPPSMQGYLEAAQNGDPKAMRMLGACYTYGLGVRPNPEQGAAWYRKAAAAGDQTAQKELKATSHESFWDRH